MSLLRKILKDRRFHRMAGLVLVLAVALALLGWRMGIDAAAVNSCWQRTEEFLAAWPWLLFLGLVILPGLPVPTSALLIVAGTVWREHPIVACAISLVALALNMTWTYWFAARPARAWVEKLLESSSVRIPELPHGNHLRILLVLRFTPGLPLFLQNYSLGFLRVPFRLYLPVSMSCSGLLASGVVLSTAGVTGGNFGIILTGVPLIVLGLILIHEIRRRVIRRAAGPVGR